MAQVDFVRSQADELNCFGHIYEVVDNPSNGEILASFILMNGKIETLFVQKRNFHKESIF